MSVFRDVTLYGKTFLFEDILVNCEAGTRSLYWKWLKKHGAHDFISELIREHEHESGFKISPTNGNLNIDRLNANNLSFVIGVLTSVKR